ncbi:MAG: hypothetical protein AB1782_10735 [Cyanobacteriota bacterium]
MSWTVVRIPSALKEEIDNLLPATSFPNSAQLLQHAIRTGIKNIQEEISQKKNFLKEKNADSVTS